VIQHKTVTVVNTAQGVLTTGSKRATEQWRQVETQKIHIMHTSPNIIWVILMRTRWTGHAYLHCMGYATNDREILTWKGQVEGQEIRGKKQGRKCNERLSVGNLGTNE
jgi:hypothetical protein